MEDSLFFLKEALMIVVSLAIIIWKTTNKIALNQALTLAAIALVILLVLFLIKN